ncbi:acyl carrier protein [Mangrovihabitans endophyticus]|uniref:Carrier domain-containing protein n=1 Tax=Mangrovihabitans endophyticus TaxID=1751298 RepID=A0A8J3BWU1_9ACTN|nr:acyl carrier protein [Mangrovihabitans endophyticus]GGK75408.1 hypothetical protein GCM10012284_06750 [Mangrovihabitans endophyticus]
MAQNGAGPDVRAGRAAVELSLRVLFGDEFVAGAEASFVDSFVTSNAAWRSTLLSLWALSKGTSSLPQAPAPDPAIAATQASVTPASPAPAALVAAPPVAAPPVAAPPVAEPPVAAPVTEVPATAAENGSSAGFEVFDPSTAAGDGMPERREPWTYEEVRATLVALLEESTGYPAEVLEDDADLEADLAIDSVKQVEALAGLRERYGLAIEDSFTIRDYRTIRQAVKYMTDRLNNERSSRAVAP